MGHWGAGLLSLLLMGCGAAVHPQLSAPSAEAAGRSPSLTAEVATPAEWRTFEPTTEQRPPPEPTAPPRSAEIPAFWLEVSQRLQDAGYPSLAGAELREVEVTVEAYDGTARRIRVQAFTRVQAERPPWAFVDGVWRQVHGMGPPRDVVVECTRAAVLRENAREWTDDARARGQLLGDPIGEATLATSEHAVWRAETSCDFTAGVQPLLRLGRADLAARLIGGPSATAEATAVRLLLEWGGELTRESWLALLHGRDEALRDQTGTLRRVFQAIDAYGVEPQTVFGPAFALMEELERGGRGPGVLTHDASIERGDTEGLIARLDELGVVETVRAVGDWRRPDFVSDQRVVSSGIARQLAMQGADAIGPLLDCVTRDLRRSRSFQVFASPFTGQLGRRREPLAVATLCALIVEPMLADDRILLGPEVREAATLHVEYAGRTDSWIAVTLLARRDTSIERLRRTARWLTLERDQLARIYSVSEQRRLRRQLAGRTRELGAREEHLDAFCDVAHAALVWDPHAARGLPDDLPCLRARWCRCAVELAVALRHQRPHEVAAWAAHHVDTLFADLARATLLLEVRPVRVAVVREIERARAEPGFLVALAEDATVLLALGRRGTFPEAASLLRAGLSSTAEVSEPVAPVEQRSASPLEPLRGRRVDPEPVGKRIADLYAHALGPAFEVPFSLDASIEERDLAIHTIQSALDTLP